MTDQSNTEQIRKGDAMEDDEILELFSKDTLFVTHFYITPMGHNIRLAAVERCPDRENIMKCKSAMVMSVASLLGLGQLIDNVKTQMINRQPQTTIDSDEEKGQKWE